MSTLTYDPKNRFAFGANWSRFLTLVDERRIADAENSLKRMLVVDDLQGKSFLDAGSGSGLFSLAARRLGAAVYSFDYDPQSVACTRELKRCYRDNDFSWHVGQGSLLDREYLAALGTYDVVYCWGVAHHTGAMWAALENLLPLVAEHGCLWIALYNDQGHVSERWRKIKQLYCRAAGPIKLLMVVLIGLYGKLRRLLAMLMSVVLRCLLLKNPLVPIRIWLQELHHQDGRGMHYWHNLIDWVGGLPFEVAKPEDVFRFMRDRGWQLREMVTCGGGLGCNEFLFVKGGQ